MLNKTPHSIDELKRYIQKSNDYTRKSISLDDIKIIEYGIPNNSNCLNIRHQIRYKRHWYSKKEWFHANVCPGAEFENTLKEIRIQLRKEKLQKIKNL